MPDRIEIGLNEVFIDYGARLGDGPDGGFTTAEFREFAGEIAAALANVNGREVMTVRVDEIFKGDYLMGRQVQRTLQGVHSIVLYFTDQGSWVRLPKNMTIQIERVIW